MEFVYEDLGGNQTVNKETLKWQELIIYDDGSIELIGSQTNQDIFIIISQSQ